MEVVHAAEEEIGHVELAVGVQLEERYEAVDGIVPEGRV